MAIADIMSGARNRARQGGRLTAGGYAGPAYLPGEIPDIDRAAGSVDLATGKRMHQLITELFPICRSITGSGFRDTLHRISQEVPLEFHEIPTGNQVFDWTIPR